ncbi:hypothetical protein Agabi119p4_470 [Agaricus bisporus var. burnettii]|uniref:Rad21/Rec8-like protein N-terminal domain-containing protein n=1 Tax=Agaricus bisporus var. burnettii TaxID=192524 RepID=A0A8H7FAK5_AGABI|nr:hypothetical protein Agabi119p4_470 [Agaricus bisporus var. burnettii]
MFFSPELLSRRDSGFGLLWLAATIGSKSVFKKLPKRSVMVADIAQLCDLIAEPTEPLALRLSSNLMYGAVRVYKVKQELFITDVNTCAAALKKMMQDMRQHTMADKNLMLAQASARPQAVTISNDPDSARALMLEELFSGWDDEGNGDIDLITNEDDDDFDPKAQRVKIKRTEDSAVGLARKDEHTLKDHHDHDTFIPGSLGETFNSANGMDLSSSQFEGRFDFEDNFLAISDGYDLAEGLGDELAVELGWAVGEPPQPVAKTAGTVDADIQAADFDMGINLPSADFDSGAQFGFDYVQATSTPQRTSNKNDENTGQSISPINGNLEDPSAPQLSQYREVGSEQPPLMDIRVQNQQDGSSTKKRKRLRLVLDARIELTDEELKIARAKYAESQKELRKEMFHKKLEKDAGKMISDIIWGAPQGINAEQLIQFWRKNFKVQAQGRININDCDDQEPLRKKRKSHAREMTVENTAGSPQFIPEPRELDDPMLGQGAIVDFQPLADDNAESAQRRSSEEPGQGRQRSRVSSVERGSQFGIDVQAKDSFGSQRSMFPWDNAGATSSAGGHFLSDRVDVADADVRLRESPLRSPFTYRSRSGSAVVGLGAISSATGGRSSQAFGEEFAIDDGIRDGVEESQISEMALVTLEKNSFNFLEYAKMQRQAKPNDELKFATIVPAVTSTRHIAATAFYHCLVLATKNLLHIKQAEPYAPIVISVI